VFSSDLILYKTKGKVSYLLFYIFLKEEIPGPQAMLKKIPQWLLHFGGQAYLENL
jgi:hypothetical protein